MRGDPAAGAPGVVEPATVQTLPELAAAFRQLRGSRSYADLDRAVNPGRQHSSRSSKDPRVLPPTTLNNLLHGKSTPTRQTVETFLTACGLDTASRQPWLAAWERVSTGHLRAPAGAVRVRQARPRLLGVHAAIQVPGTDGELPPYVPRDHDPALRTAVATAAKLGGFVLLIGGSSVGKTRALAEAVRSTVPEWWLLHPADSDSVRAFAGQPTDRTVVWLDELQRYLDHPGGLPVGVVRRLIGAGVMIVATLWPGEYGTRTALSSAGRTDAADNDRELLRLAEIVRVPGVLSPDERRRAEGLAADRRIRVALDAGSPGFTQVLAAGPALVSWWEDATDEQCYGKAVITAALDARRVGAQAPLTRGFLQAAAPGYLTAAQQATAPDDWLDQALRYATTRLHGAASTIAPAAAGMGQIAGYGVADYLHQHARRSRRTVPLPDAVWQALVEHVHDGDVAAVAVAAHRRLRVRHADALEQRLAAAGDATAATRLAHRLAQQGRLDQALTLLRRPFARDQRHVATELANLLVGADRPDEAIAVLRGRVDAGDDGAAFRLADLLVAQGQTDDAIVLLSAHPELQTALSGGFAGLRLAELLAAQGRADELEARVEAGDATYAQPRLATLLAAQGHTDRLRARAEAGDTQCARALAMVLSGRGDTAGAVALLRGCGDGYSARAVATELAKRGRTSEAVAILRAEADAHDESAVTALATLLASTGAGGAVEAALAVLEAHLGCGGGLSSAARALARLLAGQGRPDEAIAVLTAHGNRSDVWIRNDLVDLLERQGRIDEAAAVLRAGDDWYRLGGLLVMHGRLDEAIEVARALVASGDIDGPRRLAELLAEKGHLDELRTRAADGDVHAADQLVDALHRDGAVAELRALSDAGNRRAAYQLADLLVGQSRSDKAITHLRDRVAAGDEHAPCALAELLIRNGRIDEALTVIRAHVDVEDFYSAARMARLLAAHDRGDEAIDLLRPLADAGDFQAKDVLAGLFVAGGRADDLRAMADDGYSAAAGRLVKMLVAQGRTAELYDEVHAGTVGAADRLVAMLAGQGETRRAEQLTTVGL